jgi:hypothetical protein
MTTMNFTTAPPLTTRDRSLSFSDFIRNEDFLDLFGGEDFELDAFDESREETETESTAPSTEADTAGESEASIDYFTTTSSVTSEQSTYDAYTANCTRYRQDAIRRWREKRTRRSFRKKTICKARKEVAEGRPRKGGRFVKSMSSGFVAITQLQAFD